MENVLKIKMNYVILKLQQRKPETVFLKLKYKYNEGVLNYDLISHASR